VRKLGMIAAVAAALLMVGLGYRRRPRLKSNVPTGLGRHNGW
jgi:hypothetical protein